jgi:signal transduction histidine kinase
MLSSVARGKVPEPFEILFARKNGTLAFGEVCIGLLKEAGKVTGFQAIMRDVTERKKAEKKLKASREKLKTMNEKLSVVGKLTRHDARNRLTTVTNNVYLARQRMAGDKAALGYLSEIESDIGEVEKIFDFARIYEKLGVEELAYMDVGKSLEEAVMLFANLHDVRIVNNCHGLTVLADSLLRQMLYNLIDNSLKHGERVSQIRAYYERAGNDQLRLVYEDDGVGIPKGEKKKIFMEAYGKNTGYGLYLIKRMCEVYGWTIQETGKQGKGAQFTLTIPKLNKSGKATYRLHAREVKLPTPGVDRNER